MWPTRRTYPYPGDAALAGAPLGSTWELHEAKATLRAIAVWEVTADDPDSRPGRTQVALAVFDTRFGKRLPYRWVCDRIPGDPLGEEVTGIDRQVEDGDPAPWREPVAAADVERLKLVRIEGRLPDGLREIGMHVTLECWADRRSDDEMTRWVLCTADAEPVFVYAEFNWAAFDIRAHGGPLTRLITRLALRGS